MVEKLSINVRIPAINAEHHFLVPEEMDVGSAITLMVQTLEEEYPRVQKSQFSSNYLLQLSTGKMLPHAYSFKQLGILQGTDLLLL